MPTTAKSAFDCLAENYDTAWTNTVIGTQQRLAVSHRIDRLFQPGDFVLDIGCGTGVDALRLQSRGVNVHGIDNSPNMIRAAELRGVDAHLCAIEDLDEIPIGFDGAFSNFGALNCVSSLSTPAAALARLIRIGGFLAICLLGSCCAWEIAHYLAKSDLNRAFRRQRRRVTSSLGDITYFSRRSVLAAFSRDFRLVRSYGIGLFVPPSYVGSLSDRTVLRLAALDNFSAHWPVLRALADHRLYVFERI